jgi:two-component system, cell cycle response regulator
MSLSPPARTALAALGGLLLLVWTVYAANLAFGLGGEAIHGLAQTFYSGLLFGSAGLCLARGALVRGERAPWLILGASLAMWAAADLFYLLVVSKMKPEPYPSASDAGWLLTYLGQYVAVLLLLRARVRRMSAALWLDGALGGLAVTAVAAALVFQPIAAAGSGSAAAVATNLAYPIGDLLVLAFVVAAIAMTGWRPGRMWLVLGAGLALSAAADSWYLYEVAVGTYRENTFVDTLWPASTILLAAAAWMEGPPKPAVVRLEGWRAFVVPIAFMALALGLLVADHLHPLTPLALWLATAAVAVGIVRMAVTFRENLRLVASSRREALTDALTGLGNRRSLMEDMEDVLAAATPDDPRLLVLFDLNGFKHYNDSYGHPAGDELLARLGGRLAVAVAPFGTAYRLGGDEFCILARPGHGDPRPVTAAAAEALSESGEGFTVDSAHGDVLLPLAASDSAAALQLADRRMYRQKGASRDSASQQTRDVLMHALGERQPELRAHMQEVAELAVGVGRRLGMTREQLDEVARAAELHDVGKVAIPDAILENPGPLDEREWSFMRRHTLIGERILAVAPALVPVARLVRSSHERFDGDGYPDGLAGDEIPLGARIVAVCDAYDAMVSGRPYRRALTPDAALEELRRCAGSQFDPVVVEAFAGTLDQLLAPAAVR